MNSNRPGKSDRVLLISSNLLFLNLLFHIIEMVSHVAPGSRFHHHIFSLFCAYINFGILVFVKADDGAQRTVYPLVLDVVLDKDNLSTRFQVKLDRGWQTAFREFSLYTSPEEARFARQKLELTVIDVIYCIATGGQGDGKLGVAFIQLGANTLV